METGNWIRENISEFVFVFQFSFVLIPFFFSFFLLSLSFDPFPIRAFLSHFSFDQHLSLLSSSHKRTFDTYLTSEYIRAQETAGYLSLPGALWTIDPLLRERSKGIFTGTVHSRQETTSPSTTSATTPTSDPHPDIDGLTEGEDEFLCFSNRFRKEEPFYWGPPAGEALINVGDRVETYLSNLFREEEGKRVVIVCHGNLMRVFRMRLEGLTQAQYLDWERRKRMKEGGEGVLLGIDNGHVMHYTRRDPESDDITSTLQFARFHSPWQKRGEGGEEGGEGGDGLWRKVEWPLFGNEELIRHANSITQMSERREEGEGD